MWARVGSGLPLPLTCVSPWASGLNSEGVTFHCLHGKVTYSCSVTNELGVPRNEAFAFCGGAVFISPTIWKIGILSALNE